MTRPGGAAGPADRRRLRLARLLSVVGHPALVMPAAVAWSTASRGAPPGVVRGAVGLALAVAVVVCAVGLWRARSGRWQHPDASQPHERLELNRLLVLLLLGAAAAGALAGQPALVTAGLLACAGVVAVALLLRRWLKVSLHVAYALLAVALMWPSLLAMAVVVLLAAGVAWSRLRLVRHTLPEVVTGAGLGLVAGAAFNIAASLLT
jgi:hypothetical protein